MSLLRVATQTQRCPSGSDSPPVSRKKGSRELGSQVAACSKSTYQAQVSHTAAQTELQGRLGNLIGSGGFVGEENLRYQ